MINSPEILLIASGKGGVGKSTVATNLANALARKNYKTCLIDLDLNLGKLDLLLGVESLKDYDILDLATNNIPIKHALIPDPSQNNLFLIPAPRSNSNKYILTSQLESIINALKTLKFDYIIIDSPSGTDIHNPFRSAIQVCSRALIVTNQEKTALRDADCIISVLENHYYNEDNRIHIVINKYSKPLLFTKKKGFITDVEISKSLAIPILSKIPLDKTIVSSTNLGIPSYRRNKKIHNSFNDLADELIQLKKLSKTI